MTDQHVLILGCKNYPGFSSTKVISSGMEVYVTELVRYLKQRFQITIIAADSEVSRDDRVRVVSVPILGGRLLQPISLLLFSFWPAFKLRKTVTLINTQTPLSGLIAYVLKKCCGIPYIVSVHMYSDSSEHTGHHLLSSVYYQIEKVVYSAADKIVCAGYGLKNHIANRHRVSWDQLEVIHPGTGPVAIEAERPDGHALPHSSQSEGVFRVLFLGRLIQENGVMDLLAAIKLVAGERVKLLIAGNGDLEPAIRRYIEQEALHDHIELLGIVTGEGKQTLLKNVDLVIRTSYHEVFPVAYLEALSYGIPVVATPVGDTEYLAQKTGGIDLVPVRNPGKIAEAIVRQMRRKRLEPDVIRNCKQYLQSISWQSQAEKTISLFDRVLDKNGVKEEVRL